MSQSQKNQKRGGRRSKKFEPSVNPIFESWIKEWKEEAEAKDSKMKYVYAKALKSLRLFPLTLASGKECKMLENFGDHMCKMIDTRMAKENMIPPSPNISVTVQNDPQPGPSKKRTNSRPISSTHASSSAQLGSEVAIFARKKAATELSNNGPTVSQPSSSTGSGCGSKGGSEDVVVLSSDEDEAKEAPPPAKKPRTKGKPYIPAYRSGSYAILMALITKKQESCNCPEEMTKSELVRTAQKFCDTSMSKSDQATHFSGWSSMSLLLKKDFVLKVGCPARYLLTGEGEILAFKLYEAEKNLTPHCSSSSDDIDLPPIYSSGTSMIYISESSTGTDTSIPTVDIASDTETEVMGPIYEPVRLLPGNFNVVLYVDTCETSGKSKPQELVNELQKNGVTVHVTRLSVGDFVWVCREVSSATDNMNRLTMGNQIELILPYVVERKRADDLAHSIRDGRYREQKYRLERTKLQTIYLVESYGSGDWGLANGALKQAMANTQVRNGFKIQETASIKETCAYLTFMTRNLTSRYENKTLIGRQLTNYDGDARPDGPNEEYLLVFSDFNEFSAKKTNWNVMSLFARQLMRLKGLSGDKAHAIANCYPTVDDLLSAYLLCENDKERELLLANIQFGYGNRRIGPTVSRKVARYYTSQTLPL